MKKLFLITIIMLQAFASYSQTKQEFDELKKTVDSLKMETKKQSQEQSKFEKWRTTSWAKNLTLSGYIQAQWQMAQQDGLPANFAGGSFSEKSDNRFQVRRARLKAAYKSKYLSAAVQINAGQAGVTLVESAIDFHLPNEIIKVSGGLVYVPFSYYFDELSSSKRFEPEVSQAISALLPTDTYIGGQFKLKGKKGTELNNLEAAFGVYAQNGIKPMLYDQARIISRLMYNKKYDNIRWGLMASMNYGGLRNIDNNSYTFNSETKSYTENTDVIGEKNDALYWDLGMKFGFNTTAGKTDIAAEYLFGSQPSGATSAYTPTNQMQYGSVYNRKFQSHYVSLRHSFPVKGLHVVTRYDSFDGNNQISGNEIGLNSGTGIADLRLSTIGGGIIYDLLDGHLRLTAYYEHTWNEKTTNLTSYNTNFRDDIFTLRVQAKF